ncbi:MAG: hypothetical protein M3M88_01985 [Thermoproteota archaeon]|nr:hypothetical protein [Thermoproteota archaeon]
MAYKVKLESTEATNKSTLALLPKKEKRKNVLLVSIFPLYPSDFNSSNPLMGS